MPKVSVIIPTYNRPGMLKRVVEALLSQSFQDFEIIIVDSSSADETGNIAKEIAYGSSQDLVYLKQEKRGAGAARNLGIKHASGGLVVFIDDDVLPAPYLLEEHVAAHQRHEGDNIAIVGAVVYSRELRFSPFMRWLAERGPAFYQSRESDGALLDYRFFCTANLSLKRGFLLEKGAFDEQFRAFYDDIELGYRLQQEGLQIIFHKKAIGDHLRGETLEDFCERSRLSGRGGAFFASRWPQATSPTTRGAVVARMKSFMARIAVPILKPFLSWLDSHDCAVPSVVYAVMLGYYFQAGFREGIKSVEK
jgi:glycosyltransferase involved in cell wall biosynthesis